MSRISLASQRIIQAIGQLIECEILHVMKNFYYKICVFPFDGKRAYRPISPFFGDHFIQLEIYLLVCLQRFVPL